MDIWIEGFPGGATSVFATALVALVSFLYLAWTFSNRGSSGNDEVFLNRKRQTVSLKRRVELSHDVHLLRFALPSENLTLGLPVGKHFKLFAPNRDGVVQGEWNGRADSDKGEVIERKYTPTTSNDEKGYFDLVVKIYKGGVVERFPDGGKMSQYLGSLKVGEQISISGPWGINEYIGNGEFAFMKKKTKFKHIGMIAGGTGITPMLQIIDAVLKNKSDATTLSLIFANKTVEDILLKDKLDMLSQQYPKRFRVHYTLDSPPADWKYSTGFVNADMIKEYLPSASENSVVLLCGPPPMIKFACKPNLEKLGFEKSQVREF